MKERYFETVHNDGGEYPVATVHDTIEEAIEFANAHGLTLITEIGGNWDEWEKCTFCGDWFPSEELNKDGECLLCEQAIKSHGGI